MIREIPTNWRKQSPYSGPRQKFQRIDNTRSPAAEIVPHIPGTWYFYGWLLENQEVYSGQGWYNTLDCFDDLMGARNTKASQSPLYSEIEALIWAMECMRNLRQFPVTFETDCSQLVKMVSEPDEWPAFASYLEDIKFLKRSFISSELIHTPHTHNSKVNSLAHNTKKQSSFIVLMDAELQFGLYIHMILCCWQKKISYEKMYGVNI